MKLHEKITQLRKERGLKIKDLHDKLKEIFGDKALSYRTLLRIEKGYTDGRGSSLYQICLGLGILLKELRESFLALELALEKDSRTSIEKDPEGDKKFEKWLYVLKGSLRCVVKGVKFNLKKGDCISFDSSVTHFFENTASGQTRCIVVQNPRHI